MHFKAMTLTAHMHNNVDETMMMAKQQECCAPRQGGLNLVQQAGQRDN